MSAAGVGSAFYYSPLTQPNPNPWGTVLWSSNSMGCAVMSVTVPDFSMRGFLAVAYRALVVYSDSGVAVGAGLVSTVAAIDVAVESTQQPTPQPTIMLTSQPTPQLSAIPSHQPTTGRYLIRAKSAEMTRPRAAVASVAPLTSYAGTELIYGTMVVEDTMGGIEVFGTLTGAGNVKNAMGSFFIGTGVSCDSVGVFYPNGSNVAMYVSKSFYSVDSF